MATKQMTVREFGVTKYVTGRQVLADKDLRMTGMDNKEADTILQSDSLRNKYINRGLFPCWVPGTIVVYPRRGDKLTEKIVYDGITYIVPEEVLKKYGGKQDTLLVLQRDFDMDLNMVINGKVAKVLTLPPDDAWRMPDAETGIPQGREVSNNNAEARYGWFKDDSAYIGPLVRDYSGFGRRYVYADVWLDLGFGVGGLSQAKPGQSKQARALGWLVELRNTATLTESSVAKLEETTKPELLASVKELIRKVRTIDIKE